MASATARGETGGVSDTSFVTEERPKAEAPEGPSEPHARPKRRRRWAIVLAAVVVVLVALFYLGGGWYFSGRIYTKALSGAEKRAATPSYTIPVVASSADTITLHIPSDPGQLLTPGVWGLQWPTGYGQVARIQARTGSTVTRAFHLITGTEPPATGTKVALDNKAYPQDPAVGLGIPFQNVTYRGPLGDYPAWFIPGSRDTWTILVHGNSLNRLDTIKIVPVLHQEGFPILVISVRNGIGAPEDPSGMLRYGLTEWRDLQAAVTYAVGHGAQDVVLVGYSMGGGIVASFLERSPLASRVSAAILDSPMMDFGRAVDLGASDETLPVVGLPLPQSLTDVAKWIAGWRYDVDWKGLNYLAQADALRIPILLFQGAVDQTVPPATSRELAAGRSNVTLVVVPRADHLDSWNLDPAAYDAAVRTFLDRVVGSAQPAA